MICRLLLLIIMLQGVTTLAQERSTLPTPRPKQAVDRSIVTTIDSSSLASPEATDSFAQRLFRILQWGNIDSLITLVPRAEDALQEVIYLEQNNSEQVADYKRTLQDTIVLNALNKAWREEAIRSFRMGRKLLAEKFKDKNYVLKSIDQFYVYPSQQAGFGVFYLFSGYFVIQDVLSKKEHTFYVFNHRIFTGIGYGLGMIEIRK